jgi:hypothetical protein
MIPGDDLALQVVIGADSPHRFAAEDGDVVVE